MNTSFTRVSGLRCPSACPWRNVRLLRQSSRPYSGSPAWRLNSPPSGQSATVPLTITSFRGILERSSIGKLAGAYSRLQAKRPYTTQICSTMVIWLCGDLSAQLLFPPEGVKDGKEHLSRSEDTRVEPSGLHSYDPWRTTRHLIVGMVASIPSYEWYATPRSYGTHTSNIY